jgi:RNA recognition motif-containing protein
MSAIKNTGAKTVHIPLNSRTGKKRRFAIIGFKDNNSLSKAITKHVFLFDCETWWSTKDNTRTLERQNGKRKEERFHQETYQETDQGNNESEEETWSNSGDEEELSNYDSEANRKQSKYTNATRRKEDYKRQHKKEYKTYDRSHRVANKKETEVPQVLQQILDQLSQFNNRLAKVEKTNLTSKTRARSNRS